MIVTEGTVVIIKVMTLDSTGSKGREDQRHRNPCIGEPMLTDARKKVFQNRETTWRQRQKWDIFSLKTRTVRSYQEGHHHHHRLNTPLNCTVETAL